MSDQVIIALLSSGTLAFFVGCIALFGGSTSAWELWIRHRTEIGKGKLEVKKLEAAHARKCPRMTDDGAR